MDKVQLQLHIDVMAVKKVGRVIISEGYLMGFQQKKNPDRGWFVHVQQM
jgi:hypothetical protein